MLLETTLRTVPEIFVDIPFGDVSESAVIGYVPPKMFPKLRARFQITVRIRGGESISLLFGIRDQTFQQRLEVCAVRPVNHDRCDVAVLALSQGKSPLQHGFVSLQNAMFKHGLPDPIQRSFFKHKLHPFQPGL